MAVDMFMVIKGPLDVGGETKDKTYASKKGIDVLAWSWGMSNSGSAHSGGGAGAGKVNVQDMSFTKYIDKSSPNLMLGCCKGTHFDEALLVVRKSGDKPVEYLKIKMTEVLVTAVSTGGSGGEDRLTENVTLNFAKVNLDYVPQDDKGAAGTAIPMAWDISANANE
jgi:type VI secretion system secreted protein Hcp